MRSRTFTATSLLSVLALLGCGESHDPGDAGPRVDAGTPIDSGGLDSGGMCACVDTTLEWALEGGFVAYTEASEIQPCRTFAYTRTPTGGGNAESCTNELPCASSAELVAALAHADVVAAFAAAPVFYGRDSRPVDGVVLLVTQNARTITIGDPCGGTAGCTEIPAGVQALRDLLATLQSEQLALEPCATTFP